MKTSLSSVAERYDYALRYARHHQLPPDQPRPQPTCAWPAENIALLEQYQQWLLGSGASPAAVKTIYLPMAGHVLGFNLKPHSQLDLDIDLPPALAYVQAKQVSSHWLKVCHMALERFRRFLRQQRGQPDLALSTHSLNLEPYWAGLPEWLVEELQHYQRLMQRHWRPARLPQQTLSFWQSHTCLWRWLFAGYPITELTDIKRAYIDAYVDDCLRRGYAVSTINNHLRSFQAGLRYLQEQDYLVPQVLLRLLGLKEPDRLPRFLTDEQVRRLRDDLEGRVTETLSAAKRRDVLLDRAVFYLLWQGGLRLGEVEELRLDNLDLSGGKLTVRQGKGRKDRTVFLTGTVVRAVQAFLAVRGLGGSDHLFLYRNRALRKDLAYNRIKAAGQRVGVPATPHRLRHTCATQLLNAGCPATSIQKLLGHQRLNSTMVYARVHDRTVAQDYYTAMEQVEQRLDLGSTPTDGQDELPPVVSLVERSQLLALVHRLAEPQLEPDCRLDLIEQMRRILTPAPQPASATPAPNGHYRRQAVIEV